MKGGLVLSITFANGLYQSISSARPPQNSSGSSIDFLNTSSYSRNSRWCCFELWKWRDVGKAVPQRKLCVCVSVWHEFHRLWEKIFLCNLFKRAALWIKRNIVFLCTTLYVCTFNNKQQVESEQRKQITWHVTVTDTHRFKTHDLSHVHHFKRVYQTLRPSFAELKLMQILWNINAIVFSNIKKQECRRLSNNSVTYLVT